jgi:hypothetical protein
MKNALVSAALLVPSSSFLVAGAGSEFPIPGEPLCGVVPDVLPSETDDVDAKIQMVLSRLPKGAPHVTPAMIAPLVGMTANGVCKHCRNYKPLKSWNGGNYRFETDDWKHMELLVGLLRKIIFSAVNLPEDLRVRPLPVMRANGKRKH